MTDDMVSRDALRELLFDGVAPPAGSDAMFAQTFAADGADGSDLLPPDGLFDIPADADDDLDVPLDEAALDETVGVEPDGDPVDDDPTTDDPAAGDAVTVEDHPDAHDATDPEHDDTAPADGADPGHHDPGTGW